MAAVHGIDEINKFLGALPEKLQQNVIQAGNRAVAKAVADDAKTAPVSMRIRAAVYFESNPRSKITRGFLVGLRKPWSSLGHLFEFGTQNRVQKKTGRGTGRMPMTPWLRPALEKVGPRIEEIWARAAKRNLERQLKKIGL